MSKFFCAVGLLLCACGLVAQDAPVPAGQEPHHHVLLKNEYVEVMRTTLAPGESTLYHVHAYDNAGFDFVASTSTEQFLGKPEGAPSTSQAGEVWATSLRNGPYTHRVHNVGKGPMDVFFVGFLQQPSPPSTDTTVPVAAENHRARVYKWTLAPGAVSPTHTHHHPYLIVAATPLVLKMTGPDGQAMTHEVKAGDFHWIDATVTHSLANAGSAEGEIVEFELK